LLFWIPAKAGIQNNKRGACGLWVPAFAGTSGAKGLLTRQT